jgi:ATP-dependent Clp protease ATP-binding subunit ClpA
VIQRSLRDKLAELLLEGGVKDGETVLVRRCRADPAGAADRRARG